MNGLVASFIGLLYSCPDPREPMRILGGLMIPGGFVIGIMMIVSASKSDDGNGISMALAVMFGMIILGILILLVNSGPMIVPCDG